MLSPSKCISQFLATAKSFDHVHNIQIWGRRGRDRMVVGFTKSGRGVQHYVIQFVSDRSVVFSGSSGSSTNKTDRHDITEIVLKVALDTIKPKTLTCTRVTKPETIFPNSFFLQDSKNQARKNARQLLLHKRTLEYILFVFEERVVQLMNIQSNCMNLSWYAMQLH